MKYKSQCRYDLKILRQHWKGNDGMGLRVYTDEEERATTINYLKNRSNIWEEPFIDVVFKTKKNNMHTSFLVHNIHSKGRLPY